MISIIISTPDNKISDHLEKNIADTIGISYEIITIVNKQQFSLAAAYNKGASKANFSYLCFVHDDVIFLNEGWGNKLIDAMLKGWDLIGIAGSSWKPLLPFGWTTGLEGCDHVDIYHGSDIKNKASYNSGTLRPGEMEQVAVLDGVFLCCLKAHWEKVAFDEVNFTGFHSYDIDFSLRSNRVAKVGVMGGLGLLHKSEGRFDDAWLESGFKCVELHSKCLPAGKLPGAYKETDANLKVLQFWKNRLLHEPLSDTMHKKLAQCYPEWKDNQHLFSWFTQTSRRLWR